MEALQRVKLDGYTVAISELDYLRRAERYLEELEKGTIPIGVAAKASSLKCE
jgi:hypothetical protein